MTRQLKEGFVFGYTKKVQKLHIFYGAFPELSLCFVQGEFIGKRMKGHGRICKNCWNRYIKLVRNQTEV